MLEANSLATWFREEQQKTETWYLASTNPYQQSGWGSTPERWRCGRVVTVTAAVCNKLLTLLNISNNLVIL